MSTMQAYLDHLRDDLRESVKNIATNTINPVFSQRQIDRMEIPTKYSHLPVIPLQKMHVWFNIEPDVFPPEDRLDDFQVLHCCILLESMLYNYNMAIAFPKGIDYRSMYEKLREALNSYITCQMDETNPDTIDFCTFHCDTCHFGENCANMDEENGYCDTFLFSVDMWSGHADYNALCEERDGV